MPGGAAPARRQLHGRPQLLLRGLRRSGPHRRVLRGRQHRGTQVASRHRRVHGRHLPQPVFPHVPGGSALLHQRWWRGARDVRDQQLRHVTDLLQLPAILQRGLLGARIRADRNHRLVQHVPTGRMPLSDLVREDIRSPVAVGGRSVWLDRQARRRRRRMICLTGARWRPALAMLVIAVAGGCGSVNSAGGDAAAGTSGQAGSAGGGAAGTGGSSAGRGGGGGFAGSAGGGGSGDGCGPGYPVGSSRPAGDGCNVCNCIASGTWVCSTAACPIGGGGGGGTAGAASGVAGVAGTAGRGGAGGEAGRGGAGRGGSGGSSGGGGAGGATSPCQAVLALDRSCTTPADCFAGAHTTDCCGNGQFVGFRVSEMARFQTLEAQCDATYPGCGCPAGPPTADDGSRLRFNQQAGVTCLQGKCTTFVPDCGQPCGSGTTCFSCANHATIFAACTTTCADTTACNDPTLPLCQTGASGNVSGKYCTAANVACDTR